MIFFLRYIIMTEKICNFKNAWGKPTNYPCFMADSLCSYNINGKLECPPNEPNGILGATSRIADAANKSLPKENARLVKQVLGGLAGFTSAACVVTAYIAAEKARKEKHVLNKVLTGAAAAGTLAAAVEIALQSYDLFMEKEQPNLGDQGIPDGKLYQ
jgi:hypothetical protein